MVLLSWGSGMERQSPDQYRGRSREGAEQKHALSPACTVALTAHNSEEARAVTVQRQTTSALARGM